MRNRIPRSPLFTDRCRCLTAAMSSSLVLTLLTASLLTSTTLAKDEITSTQKFTGKVNDSALLSKRPKSGVVTDQANWKSLWTAWRTDKDIMKVDFQNQIVLVATANGPNLVFTSSLNLTPSGDLRYEVASTKMAGPGFGYALLVIPRNRIVSVNGLKLAAPSTPLKPAEKSAQAPSTMLKPNQAIAKPVEGSIRVDIFGRVGTEMISRAESTGTMVVANGIVWELDLGNDPQLINAAKQLGTSIGNIKGTLSKRDKPDRSFRWIVDVESIRPAPSANNDTGVAISDSSKALLPATKTPMTTQQKSPSIEPLIDVGSGRKTATPTTIPVSPQNSFRSIVVSATGGQSSFERKQTVTADGSVTLEVPKTNYSESFSLDANSLSDLHAFIANTDWRTVPRSTGTAGKDTTNFLISIETESGMKRFFIDGPSIASQPVIARLFSLMRKPKTDQ